MRDLSRERQLRAESVIRISVSGSGNAFTVRTGDEAPVQVRRRGMLLLCDCGLSHCAHIASLQMCGFVEASEVMPRAA